MVLGMNTVVAGAEPRVSDLKVTEAEISAKHVLGHNARSMRGFVMKA